MNSTGTYHFDASDLLTDQPNHQVHRDLGSFFWALLWVVFQHTDCYLRSSSGTVADRFRSMFKWDNSLGRVGAKIGWLRLTLATRSDPNPLVIRNNSPLTTLLQDFSRLVAIQTAWSPE